MDSCDCKRGIYRLHNKVYFEPESKLYLKERERLRTFYTSNNKYPHRLPSASSLARAGFYYSGEHDKVTCAFCSGTLGDWTIDDDPIKEHQFWFPHCDFVKGKFSKSGNQANY
ncbi:uncharacterized protein B4U80_00746 [Leptotrombidium deliense]|uniref:Uncharacterized protein n=1 Tax=Leptotrombidium deliense TaxID=299467 RepID=A0A443S991_9ACAR|nr:uncharacterized protein B4U80_00746 [Leptotrombidium deliense]